MKVSGAEPSQKIGLLLGGLLIALIWGEVLARVFYTPPSFHTNPSLFNRLRGQRPRWHSEGTYKLGTPEHPRLMHVTTNSYGFRGDEFKIPKPAGVHRILCLGDSITFGWGVDNEQTFPALLQQRLRQAGLGAVEVLNAGIGDIGTEEELDELPAFLDSLEIDEIILGFYLNDSRPPQGFHDEFMYEGAVNRFFRTSTLVRHSYLLRWIYERLLSVQMANRLKKDPVMSQRFAWSGRYRSRRWEKNPEEAAQLIQEARYDWGAAWIPASWSKIDHQFKRLQGIARPFHISITVLALPVTVQAYGKADNYPQQQLAGLAHAYGWRYVDVLPAMKKYPHPNYFFFDQCHLTPLGNQVVADSLAHAFLTP
jgi:lysophospholipase L1-like esterase